QPSNRFAVAKVGVTNFYVVGETGNVRVLNLRIVKIIEVIQDDDFMPRSEQLLDKVRPDKPSTASDQDSHAAKLATDGHRSTEILQLRGFHEATAWPVFDLRLTAGKPPLCDAQKFRECSSK